MGKQFRYIVFVLCLAFPSVRAQVAMGKWRTHLSYNNVSTLTQSRNKVYAVGNGALFSVDKRDGSMEVYDKGSGLNDASIAQVAYSPAEDCLLLVYANGNMDVMRSGGVVNIPDLYNKQLATSKAVNDIQIHGEKAYLACDFGVLVINLAKNEVGETCYIGADASPVRVLNTVILGDTVYAATDEGLYATDYSNPNIMNYEVWARPAIPHEGAVEKVSVRGDDLLLLQAGELYRRSEGNWKRVLDTLTFCSFHVSEERLHCVTGDSTCVTGDTLFVVGDDYRVVKHVTNMGALRDVVYDAASDKVWTAGGSWGVVAHDNATEKTSSYKPAGPAVNLPYKLYIAGDRLFMLQGGRWNIDYRRGGLVMIHDQWWRTIYSTQCPKIEDKWWARDFVGLIVDPEDTKHFFVASYAHGLYEFRNDTCYAWYTHKNSSLSTIYPNGTQIEEHNYIRVDGGLYDSKGNLWVVSAGVTNGLNVYGTDGKWYPISFGDVLKKETLGNLLIPDKRQESQKWLLSHRGTPGIVFFDDGGSPYDNSDDYAVFQKEFVDQDGNVVAPDEYYCMVTDKDGAVWVGTETGPLVFPNPTSVFGKNQCMRIKIPRNDGTNFADFLLENERITAIAVDGANRKWLGTEYSGVYLMSADGQKTIHHFTTQNSLLLSNSILSLAIDPQSGEVFIGTSAGLVSYQSDAADGGEDFGDIYAYPNPVREGFDGLITITGLVNNSVVKIMDVGGNVVCETRSNGSLAVWDGKNKWGQCVGTGVYVAVCLSEDGSQKGVTKILIIK